MVMWLRLHAPNSGGPGSIPTQGTRSHMHATTKSSHAATKEPESQLRSLPPATKTPHNQINK